MRRSVTGASVIETLRRSERQKLAVFSENDAVYREHPVFQRLRERVSADHSLVLPFDRVPDRTAECLQLLTADGHVIRAEVDARTGAILQYNVFAAKQVLRETVTKTYRRDLELARLVLTYPVLQLHLRRTADNPLSLAKVTATEPAGSPGQDAPGWSARTKNESYLRQLFAGLPSLRSAQVCAAEFNYRGPSCVLSLTLLRPPSWTPEKFAGANAVSLAIEFFGVSQIFLSKFGSSGASDVKMTDDGADVLVQVTGALSLAFRCKFVRIKDVRPFHCAPGSA